MGRQVFFDASGARTRWTSRAVLIGTVTFFLLAILFAATVIDVPQPMPLALSVERSNLHAATQSTLAPPSKASMRGGFRDKFPMPAANGTHPDRLIRVGFYAPWDENGVASLHRHIGQLDWVVAGLMSVTGPDHRFRALSDGRLDAAVLATKSPVAVFPMIQNAVEGDWDSAGAAALLHDRVQRTQLITKSLSFARARRAPGLVFDFEDLPPSANADYLKLLQEARILLSEAHMQLLLTIAASSSTAELKGFAGVADKVLVKFFDEHGAESSAGPIASQAWFMGQFNRAKAAIGPDKLISTVGSFAYDWPEDGDAEPVSVEEAWLTARDSEAAIAFDPVSGNPDFSYEEGTEPHRVWMLDAATAWNQMRVAQLSGVAGIAIWRLGTEDNGVWPALAGLERNRLPPLSLLSSMTNVDVEGSGEILRITSTPTNGSRTVEVDRHNMVVNETYHQLPTPFVVDRTGNRPNSVVLSFDDGPDPQWTPQVLKILREKHVPAAFFIIGENALGHPQLLNQIVDEGHELGSHTYTHPNVAAIPVNQARLELNVTQRLVQAYTGRSLRLFRAPYFSDAEAKTADELGPALLAQNMGYTNVGLHVDPHDWQKQSASSIVQSVVRQVEGAEEDDTRQIVLLHDSGGDRSQTVAALPQIIDDLRARGYEFVSISKLAGLSREGTMPKVGKADLFAVRSDIGLFLIFAALGKLLGWIFYGAIMIGILRAIILTGLAFYRYHEDRRRAKPHPNPSTFVSVIVPAYNEERVIAASVRRVLASVAVRLEVIVVDDGSRDATSNIVQSTFGENPAVKLLTLPNGGKAKALNQALAIAKGDVLIALDADTLFEPTTIARLCRWFYDPKIGAVAGNVKVGNKINFLTRWQAIEYVTAQNLERRALAAIDSMMVVPGAVGAIRRSALEQAGGYPEDTLAEDQDLTIQIQRDGWKVIYDPVAMAWTEAPETFAALSKQRFRWAFGTLQCLWKHRAILKERTPRGLALIGLPQTWLLQIGFALIAPLIDIMLILNIIATVVHVVHHGWAQMSNEVMQMGIYWLVFTTIDALCGYLAYAMEPRHERYPVLMLIAQRFIYRQLMYWAVIKAVMSALRGPAVRWGKLGRSGRVGTRHKRKLKAVSSA